MPHKCQHWSEERSHFEKSNYAKQVSWAYYEINVGMLKRRSVFFSTTSIGEKIDGPKQQVDLELDDPAMASFFAVAVNVFGAGPNTTMIRDRNEL